MRNYEEDLYDALERFDSRIDDHLASIEWLQDPAPKDLKGIVGIGIDTNVLKQFRRGLLGDRLSAQASTRSFTLIIPSQSINEFWNNQHVFAREDLNKVSSHLSQARAAIAKLASESSFDDEFQSIVEAIDRLSMNLDESTSPNFLLKSSAVLEDLLRFSIVPRLSRGRFRAIAEARLRSKVPPGFGDSKKILPLGDVYAWLEFLAGVNEVRSGLDPEYIPHFLWVTDDSKVDWKTSGRAHPSLTEEAFRLTRSRVSIIGSDELQAALAASEEDGPSEPSDDDSASTADEPSEDPSI